MFTAALYRDGRRVCTLPGFCTLYRVGAPCVHAVGFDKSQHDGKRILEAYSASWRGPMPWSCLPGLWYMKSARLVQAADCPVKMLKSFGPPLIRSNIVVRDVFVRAFIWSM